ncbi:uncharacterized protein LOC134686634 [Mytilus trossulus]|uniref:uncharacterized protein LOC134686634 n=1 Tax=Mytilus trossulus TaxID=6551 RepID=UPI0030067E6D
MEEALLGITILITLSEISCQIYEFDSTGACCNGTLGYAFYDMPCASLKCCDPSETVSVSPVNAALGYVFRCTTRSKVKNKCVKRGNLLISTDEPGIKYGSRICCKGLELKVYFNQPSAAFSVKCVDSYR